MYCLNTVIACKSLWINVNVISKSCHRGVGNEVIIGNRMIEPIIEIQAHFARVDHVVIEWLSLFK